MSKNTSVIKVDKLDVSKIIFTKLEDNPRVKSQKLGYVRYKASDETDEIQLKIQSPEIDAEAYGIPRKGPYYDDAKSRSFYKYPFCHDLKRYNVDYAAIEEFHDKLAEIDEFCNTDEFRKHIFGEKAASQYAYQPLLRIPEVDYDETKVDKNGQPFYRPPYTKIKLDLEFSPDPENQSTKPTFAIFERKDGKRSKIELNTFEDVVSILKYRSKLRFIISFSKIYAMKTKSGTEKKKYGIIIKATHIEVQRPAGASRVPFDEDAFIDSESDTDDAIKSNVTINRRLGTLDIEDEDDEQEVIEQVSTKHLADTAVDAEDVEEDVVEEVIEDIKPKTKSKTNKFRSKPSAN